MKIIKKFISAQSGQAEIYILLIFMVAFLVLAAGSIGFVWRFWLIKNQMAQGLHEALVQAASSESSYSMQYGDETGSNQMLIDQDDAQNTFNAVLSLDLGTPGNQYTVDDFVVYGPTDQGKPLPNNYPGVIPGTSLYAHITVKIPIGEMVGMPTLSNVTFYMPIDQLVAPNRFIDQQEQWQGG